jgi:hypothetical protein
MRKSKLNNMSVLDNTGQRIIPNLIVGEPNGYSSGDILDANAAVQLIGSGGSTDLSDYAKKSEVTAVSGAVGQVQNDLQALSGSVSNIQGLISADENIQDEVINRYDEIVAFLNSIEDDSTLIGILDGFAAKDAEYTNYDSSSYGVMSNSVRKVVTLSQTQYNALVSLDPNTEYNII